MKKKLILVAFVLFSLPVIGNYIGVAVSFLPFLEFLQVAIMRIPILGLWIFHSFSVSFFFYFGGVGTELPFPEPAIYAIIFWPYVAFFILGLLYLKSKKSLTIKNSLVVLLVLVTPYILSMAKSTYEEYKNQQFKKAIKAEVYLISEEFSQTIKIEHAGITEPLILSYDTNGDLIYLAEFKLSFNDLKPKVAKPGNYKVVVSASESDQDYFIIGELTVSDKPPYYKFGQDFEIRSTQHELEPKAVMVDGETLQLNLTGTKSTESKTIAYLMIIYQEPGSYFGEVVYKAPLNAPINLVL